MRQLKLKYQHLDERVVDHVYCHGVSPKELTQSAPKIGKYLEVGERDER